MPGAMLRETNKEETLKFIALTYGTLTLLDAGIGQILDTLNKLGYNDDTIVIYNSDHGDLMGEHGMLFKGPSAYMGVFHIPMIWKLPEITKKGTTDALISSIDYPSTLLSLLNIPQRKRPPDMQGYDMTPVLLEPENPNIQPRDCCLIENDEEVGPVNARLRHLITKKYKLTVYEGFEDYGDLFDWKEEREEIENLWFKSKFKDVRFTLTNQLLHECLKVQSRYPKRIAGT
jgi:arylsulfatase A-like enzyme